MLEEKAIVFLMNTNCILDVANVSILRRELCVKIPNVTLAIASELQAVGHVSSAVLAQVECMLSLMWVFRVATVSQLASCLSNNWPREAYYGTTISASERR